MADQTTTTLRAGTFELFAINAYWPGLSFMWNSPLAVRHIPDRKCLAAPVPASEPSV